jgi:hypothetical protein
MTSLCPEPQCVGWASPVLGDGGAMAQVLAASALHVLRHASFAPQSRAQSLEQLAAKAKEGASRTSKTASQYLKEIARIATSRESLTRLFLDVRNGFGGDDITRNAEATAGNKRL